ncbi:MAG: Hsp20/alpha crystallin family protein [Chitinophagales bacterium]
MTLVKWNKPKNEASPNVFGNPFDSFFNDDFFSTGLNTTQPAVNIRENDSAYGIEIAAPGLTKKDFNIDLDQDILTVSVEKSNEKEDKDDGYTRKEFSYESFRKSFTLPDSVKGENIKAEYQDGLLKLTLPKKEEAKALKKKISIS